MKNWLLLFVIYAGFGTPIHAQIRYSYETSLKELSNDKLAVHLKIGGFTEDTLTYCFPKIIPGIYGAMNFGQYISEFQVFDKKGKKLKTPGRFTMHSKFPALLIWWTMPGKLSTPT